MNETNSVPYLNEVLKVNEALLGLPALPLVLLLAIALGYVLKFIPVYPNNWIPIGVIVGSMAANVGIAYNDGSGNYARAFIYGLIVGVASIAIHRKWLRDWLDPKMFGAFLLFGLLSLGLVGCVGLQPGADPLVVRTEQFLTGAQGTFQYVLKVDQLDRAFWQTQAPAFHAFCEELRRPTPYQVTNTLPQYRVALLSLADVKRDYQTAQASSNDLFTALSTLQSVNAQANAWLTIVTNRPK